LPTAAALLERWVPSQCAAATLTWDSVQLLQRDRVRALVRKQARRDVGELEPTLHDQRRHAEVGGDVLVYSLHIGLALLTGVLCLFVNTRPAPTAKG
jgi:hypothetical protein